MSGKVSIILTVYNGGPWIEACFKSISVQSGVGSSFDLEVCVFDDGSTDNSFQQMSDWNDKFSEKGITLTIIKSEAAEPKGVGYGRNMAIAHSSGEYLCFQDIDDIMLPDRIFKQFMAAHDLDNDTIIGSKFIRSPKNSTHRFTRWANTLPQSSLALQVYTSHGPTIIMPTWFMHRSVFNKVGKFSEKGAGTPEDLIFFYQHLDTGGKVFRVDETLLQYTYHAQQTSFSVKSDTIWDLRIERLVKQELEAKRIWKNGFYIWNAGKQGRKFYRSLSSHLQSLVIAFCDVDPKLIGKSYKHFDSKLRKEISNVPIISYTEVKPPVIICVKLDLTNGTFENNLKSLQLTEGRDYIIFS